MILDRTPLNYTEVGDILKDLPESHKTQEIELFLKKFNKTKAARAKKIKEELEKMDLLKLKREHLVKIVDLLPEDATDLNKIFSDISLNEDEINKILDVVKKSK